MEKEKTYIYIYLFTFCNACFKNKNTKTTHETTITLVYDNDKLGDPTDNYEICCMAWKGAIANSMLAAYEASTEKDCTLKKAQSTMEVIADKSFGIGKCRLVAMSPSISIVLQKNGKSSVAESPTCIILDKHLFDFKGEKAESVIRQYVSLPNPAIAAAASSGVSTKLPDPFVSKFWHVRSTPLEHEANVIRELVEVNTKSDYEKKGKIERTCKIATIVNIKALKEGDELCYHKPPEGLMKGHVDDASDRNTNKGNASDNKKKAKSDNSKGKGKGKKNKK